MKINLELSENQTDKILDSLLETIYSNEIESTNQELKKIFLIIHKQLEEQKRKNATSINVIA